MPYVRVTHTHESSNVSIIFSLFHLYFLLTLTFVQYQPRGNIYMLFTGWEVRTGRNCARGLEYRPRPQAEGGTQTKGTVSPNTDRPKQVNNIYIFLLLRFKVSGKFYFSLQPMCVEEGRVRVDVIKSARSIANPNKTLQHDF